MNRFLLLILGALCFYLYGCSEKEEEPVDLERMVQSGEEEAPEWTPPVDVKLLTGDPYPQEMVVPEGRELVPEAIEAELLR